MTGRRRWPRRLARPARRCRGMSTASARRAPPSRRPPAGRRGNVPRAALPPTDIKAPLDGVELKPGFALGGWLAFEPMGNQTMVMGDLVLTEDEVNPVMAKL